MAKISDISSEIFLELGQPEDISIASIAQKLRNTIGEVNNLLNTNFYIDTSTFEVINADDGREINVEQSSILKKIYEIFYLRKQSKSFLGANGIDQVKSINQDSIVVTLVERNQNAKNYAELAKEAKNELRQLLNSYKQNRAIPRQVVGDDTLTNIGAPIINPLNNATYPNNSSNRYGGY